MRSDSRREYLLACDLRGGLCGSRDPVLQQLGVAQPPVLLHRWEGSGDIPAYVDRAGMVGSPGVEGLDGAYQSVGIRSDPGNGYGETRWRDVGITLRGSVPLLDHAGDLLADGGGELLMLVVEMGMGLFGPNSDFTLRTDHDGVVLGWCKGIVGHCV